MEKCNAETSKDDEITEQSNRLVKLKIVEQESIPLTNILCKKSLAQTDNFGNNVEKCNAGTSKESSNYTDGNPDNRE